MKAVELEYCMYQVARDIEKLGQEIEELTKIFESIVHQKTLFVIFSHPQTIWKNSIK